ncbi:MAG: type II secretion system F family protein, partial [Planctomycetaceae bacterium]|nr:type II secretion system F family protein [Planctomycetaceae bacterium]
MPVFTYEAMDNSGLEVKEEIEAPSEEEARQMIREKGFYPTRISEKSTRKKKDDKGKKRPQAGGKPKKAFTIGGVSA